MFSSSEVKVKSLCHVQLFVTLWTVACQALLYMGFSSKSIGLPVLPPGGLSHPRIKPMSYMSPALTGRFFTPEPPGKAPVLMYHC